MNGESPYQAKYQGAVAVAHRIRTARFIAKWFADSLDFSTGMPSEVDLQSICEGLALVPHRQWRGEGRHLPFHLTTNITRSSTDEIWQARPLDTKAVSVPFRGNSFPRCTVRRSWIAVSS